MKKKIIYITIFVLSVILIANSYAEISIIDSILGLFGLSGSTYNNGTTIYVSTIILMISLVVSYFLVKRIYEREGKRVGSNMIILSIVFWIMFPLISKLFMNAIHYNSTSLSSIQVTESTCNFSGRDGTVQANCDITLFNFGKPKVIELTPVLKATADISFDSHTYHVSGHSENHLGMSFTGEFSGEDFSPAYFRDVEFEVSLVEE